MDLHETVSQAAALSPAAPNPAAEEGVVGDDPSWTATVTPADVSTPSAASVDMPDEKIAGDPPWLVAAFGEVGVHETPGAANNARIVEYHQCTSLRATDDETPWCSSFENWLMSKAGLAGTNSAQARSWLDWGVETEVQRGAVCVLRRGSDAGQGHVGNVVSWTDSHVRLISGNVGDGVCVRDFPRTLVLGYRWPKSVAASTTVRAAAAEGTLIVAEKVIQDPSIQKLIDMSGTVNATLALVFMIGHVSFLGWIAYQRILRLQNEGK